MFLRSRISASTTPLSSILNPRHTSTVPACSPPPWTGLHALREAMHQCRNAEAARGSRYDAIHRRTYPHPVLEVYCAPWCKLILTWRVPGTALRSGWLVRSDILKEEILAQLKGMVDEMRLIPCPRGQSISDVAG